MEIAFQEKTWDYLQQVSFETINQEEIAQTVVPDSYPDVERIVNSFGLMTIRSKECQQGSVSVNGGVNTGVLYVDEDGGQMRLLEIYVPFTIRRDLETVTPESTVVLQCSIKYIDARVVNSRKIMVRIGLTGSLLVLNPAQKTLYAAQQEDPLLQVHTRSYPVMQPVESAEKLFTMEEELELPSSRPAITQVLRHDIVIEPAEQRLAGGKLVFKGTVRVHVLYLTTDNCMAAWDFQVPFSQFVELQGNYETEEPVVRVLVSDCELTMDGQPDCRRLNLNLVLLAQCVVNANQMWESVDDAYYLGSDVQLQRSNSTQQCRIDRQTVNQTAYVTVSGQAQSVEDTQVWLDCPAVSRNGMEAIVTVPVQVEVCFRDMQGNLCHGSGKTQVRFDLQADPQAVCRADASLLGEVYAVPGADGIDVRFGVELNCEWYADMTLDTVSGLSVQEREKAPGRGPSVILRAMPTAAPVWDLAKAADTTVEQICKANHLTQEEVPAGELLLIPMS